MAYLKKEHFEDFFPEGAKFKRLSPNAMEYNFYGETGVIYEYTVVARKQGPIITLNTGGRSTNTTKKWMNHFLQSEGYSVFQKNWTRYVKTPSGDCIEFDDRKLVLHTNK